MNLCTLTEYLRQLVPALVILKYWKMASFEKQVNLLDFFFWQLRLNIDSLALHLTDPEHLPL